MSDKKSLFKKKIANFFFLDAKKENKNVVEKILKLIYRSTDRLKQKNFPPEISIFVIPFEY